MVERMVLWDIDGTLLRAGDIGAAVFDQAIEAVLGAPPPARISMSGKTDPSIVREYLALMAVEETDDLVEAILGKLAANLAAAADAGILSEEGRACPGVPEVLDGLALSDGVVQTLLTGNIYPNAVVKVSAYGLDKWLDLDIGAYGSDHDDRNQLVPVALDRLAERHGTRLTPSDVWVVGDTPRDLACARAVGARCLLVATGRYPFAELAGLGADSTLADLSDHEAVIDLLA
ncbi:MAG: haloacid dehalogenase-like hydrolase [Acidobacteriota bacterium]|nr:haloacid dehalogenase-like hydrolase [Acidobacteriota bacterium]